MNRRHPDVGRAGDLLALFVATAVSAAASARVLASPSSSWEPRRRAGILGEAERSRASARSNVRRCRREIAGALLEAKVALAIVERWAREADEPLIPPPAEGSSPTRDFLTTLDRKDSSPPPAPSIRSEKEMENGPTDPLNPVLRRPDRGTSGARGSDLMNDLLIEYALFADDGRAIAPSRGGVMEYRTRVVVERRDGKKWRTLNAVAITPKDSNRGNAEMMLNVALKALGGTRPPWTPWQRAELPPGVVGQEGELIYVNSLYQVNVLPRRSASTTRATSSISGSSRRPASASRSGSSSGRSAKRLMARSDPSGHSRRTTDRRTS